MTRATLTLLALSLLVSCRSGETTDGAPPDAESPSPTAMTPVPHVDGSLGGALDAANFSGMTPMPEPTATPGHDASGEMPPLAPAPAATVVVQAYSAPPATVQAAESQHSASRGTPEPVAAPTPGTSLQAAAVAAGWPPHLAQWVERTALCESSGSVSATNGPHYGLMQQNVNLHGHPGYDAVSQLASAYEVYQKQGAAAWACG